MTGSWGVRHASLSFPAARIFIPAALDYTESLAASMGFGRSEQIHLRLAMEEILEFLERINTGSGDAPPVSFCFEARADSLVIHLKTLGMPFDINRLPSYSPDSKSDDDDLDGLGLHLANWALDEVRFHNMGREGIRAELVKYRTGGHVQNLTSINKPLKAASPVKSYSIRKAHDADSLEISRCAYLTYGHTYEGFIYYPERITEMNRSSELYSLVAEGTSGEIMGHCGLKCTPGRTDRAELGVLFVRPEYRRHKVGQALWKATVDLARNLGFGYIVARSVTGHKASQRLAHSSGFHDCCLFLALCPQNVELRDIGGIQQGKMSLMLQWLPLGQQRMRTIFPPECYGEIVQTLYSAAKIPFHMADRQTKADSEKEHKLHTSRIPELNVGILEIEDVGSNSDKVSNWIRLNTRRLCREKLDTIYLFLNLEHPGTPCIADECAQAGYVFAGISPDNFPMGDALVMQYLNLAANPLEHLSTEGEIAELLHSFIRAEWKKREIFDS